MLFTPTAIQSIGVCRQQLEKDKSYGLFRILFPAILLHGTYDFSIMLVEFLLTVNPNAEDAAVQVKYSLIALSCSVVFVLLGIFYYAVESHRQIHRLDQIAKSKAFVGVAS